MTKPLALPQVTLCAVTSVNLNATLRAMEICLDQIDFAQCKLFTDARVTPANPKIEIVPVQRMTSSQAYSRFVLSDLADHVTTSHGLLIQWDGHVIDATRWSDDFLDYDYIGASWPQFADEYTVGNGGFSLRSKRLMEACRHPDFNGCHPEDVTIARTNRAWLESKGFRFPGEDIANRFSTERAGDIGESFGFHGVFNMPSVLGVEGYWDVYRSLDDRSSLKPDFGDLMRALRRGDEPARRTAKMLADRFCDFARALLR